MTHLQSSAIPWAVVSVQILGILSACLARCSEGCACQKFFQGLFFLLLAMVGCSTVASLRLQPESWLTNGTILAIMVVVATYQPGRSGKAVAW